MEQYCIYLRKSRTDIEAEQQGEGETLARHEMALLELARRQDLHVAEIYREIVSGESIDARPVMQQLLEEVNGGRWDGVLVMEIERLARGDTIDQGVVAQAFRYSATKIVTPLKTYDPDNEFDEEYFEFGLFMSRREYRAINRRMQRGRLASVQEGKYVGSTPPYGYHKVKLPDQKGFTLAPTQEQADVVRQIFDWYVDGIEGIRLGTTRIANRLNDMGIPPAKKHWTASSVRDMLLNPIYIGKVRWNWRAVQKKMVDGQRVDVRPRTDNYELVDGLHPAIVDPHIWERAQALQKANRIPKSRPGTTIKNPLAGLLVCSKCGNRMTRRIYKRSPDGIGCVTPRCKMPSSQLHQVEARVLELLAEWLTEYKLELESEKATPPAQAKLLPQMETELAELQRQKDSLHELLERGVYDVDTFLSRSQVVAKQLTQVQEAVQSVKQEQKRGEVAQRNRAKLVPAVVHVLETYNDCATPAQKNVLLKEVLDRVEYFREEGGRWSKTSFLLRLQPKVDGS